MEYGSAANTRGIRVAYTSVHDVSFNFYFNFETDELEKFNMKLRSTSY